MRADCRLKTAPDFGPARRRVSGRVVAGREAQNEAVSGCKQMLTRRGALPSQCGGAQEGGRERERGTGCEKLTASVIK